MCKTSVEEFCSPGGVGDKVRCAEACLIMCGYGDGDVVLTMIIILRGIQRNACASYCTLILTY